MFEHLIDLGYTDAEIEAEFDRLVERDARKQEIANTRDGRRLDWGSLHDRNRLKSLLAETRGRPRPGRRRARVIPDVETAIRSAVAALTRAGTKRTWSSVATEIGVQREVPVSERTLYDWCKKDKLPHPGDPYWDEPASV